MGAFPFERPPMPVPKDLLELLVCAFCKGDLREEGDSLRCLKPGCGLVYPVKEGIPVMLVDEADRSCPSCKASRQVKEDVLSCPSCGAVLRYERA
jgi:uncharacterized protein YbaR (Trm112 family)